MTIRPDPTFHATAKLAMEAPAEKYAYCLMLSPISRSGWYACSSALLPLSGHAFLERRYLIIPGLRSSRIYVIDTRRKTIT